MGIAKQLGKFHREQRKEAEKHPLFIDTDSKMKEIEEFYAKHPLVQGELAKEIKAVRDKGAEREAALRERQKEITDETVARLTKAAREKIAKDYEPRYLKNFIDGVREEHAILSQHKLWPVK